MTGVVALCAGTKSAVLIETSFCIVMYSFADDATFTWLRSCSMHLSLAATVTAMDKQFFFI